MTATLHTLGTVVRLAGLELVFWLLLPVRLVRGHPRSVFVALWAAAAGVWLGFADTAEQVGYGVLCVAVGFRVWRHAHRSSFQAVVAGPHRRTVVRRRVRRWWPVVCDRTGLTATPAGEQTSSGPAAGRPARVVPPVRCRWRAGRLVLTPGLLVGQDLGVWERAAEPIRLAAGAARVEVRPTPSRTGLAFWLGYGDPLTTPARIQIPAVDGRVDLAAVPLGVCEGGGPLRVRLGVHTLVAGSSGAGKASAVHGLLIGLGPAIRAGLVDVHGIDLKGGMELGMPARMLSRLATTPTQAVTVLEDAAAAMAARAGRLAGRSRMHTPTSSDPLVLVLIDELAALTAYATDRDIKQRAGAALALLLSQGRAVGFQVVACVQDPRKDVIPMRGLFTQTLGLRLRDWAETDMILGPAARQAGAACEQIPASLPGVGWMITDTGGPPVRFRLSHVTDTDIATAATRFPTAHKLPMPASAESNEAAGASTSTRGPGESRKPRKPRTRRASSRADATKTDGSGSDAA